MKKLFYFSSLLSILFLMACGGGSAAPASAAEQAAQDAGERIISIETAYGTIKAKLYNSTPQHRDNFIKLANEGFYDGTLFHRVIDGFMAQVGCPNGTGMGGSDKPNLQAEFNPEPHVRGTCSMARAQHPDSADSQFFICFDRVPHLDGQYTAWGQVVSGMEHVDNIKKGGGSNGIVSDPDSIVTMRVAADV